MSNEYYVYSNTLLPGQVARAEDVAAEMSGVQSAFDLLPEPRPDGEGFAVPFTIEPAVQDNQAATWGQLKTLEQSAQDAADAAALSETAAFDSETNAGLSATAASDSETAAGLSESNAATSEGKAQQWADAGEDVEVETGKYSAKHWATKAEQITSGARSYQGTYDASGGSYPIASPVSGDEGKYWLISEDGTLPAGPVVTGDELAISASLDYEIINLSSVYAQRSNNLSDLNSASSARGNLGLGTAAVENVGTGANQIAKRDNNGNVPGNVAGKALTLDEASETVRGSVKLASSATMRTGTNATEAATPAGVSAVIPKGVIVLWSGSTSSIPTGWALCNGANGTPDLRDRFVVGAGSTYSVDATGGSANAVVVSHSHGASTGSAGNHSHSGSTNTTGSHSHTVNSWRSGGPNGGSGAIQFDANKSTSSAGSHSHSLSINSNGSHSHSVSVGSTGESGTNKNLPPYYALAYIMRL